MRELRLLRDLRWPATAVLVGVAVEVESERGGIWKELRRAMNALRGRLLLVMEPARLSGCMVMGSVKVCTCTTTSIQKVPEPKKVDYSSSCMNTWDW
jgi:hypothetical protein